VIVWRLPAAVAPARRPAAFAGDLPAGQPLAIVSIRSSADRRREEEAMTFGQAISAERKKQGLKRKDLAAKVLKGDGLPISPQYLNDIELDRRNPPSEDLIEQMATALGLEADYLYYLAGRLPPQDRDGDRPRENVLAAFVAFRKELARTKPRRR
jgi:transcriptional regulator with XRE-family HTH domain